MTRSCKVYTGDCTAPPSFLAHAVGPVEGLPHSGLAAAPRADRTSQSGRILATNANSPGESEYSQQVGKGFSTAGGAILTDEQCRAAQRSAVE